MSKVLDVFERCVKAIHDAELIKQVSVSDKEFHFQNWVTQRIEELGINYEVSGRNTYPDITLVQTAEGYEIKGLAYPGRENSYDSNSQVPTGFHNGREIFYVFGRYPKEPQEKEYPVIDLVICHGDLLNADHDYVHKNSLVKGFGTYGDIQIRDRKMYVCPTPFAIATGLTGTHTLILPEDYKVDKRMTQVGKLSRVEVDEIVVGYEFNLQTNEITTQTIENHNKGKQHQFNAYRLTGESSKKVNLNEDRA